MEERLHDVSAILRVWVTLRLNFTLNITFCANIYGLLDGGLVILQPCHLKSSHKVCCRLYSIEVDFYSRNEKKSLFEPPFGDLGVTYTLHL